MKAQTQPAWLWMRFYLDRPNKTLIKSIPVPCTHCSFSS